jgi:hypothetical protein
MKIVKPLEEYTRSENDVICFLAGSCSSNNKWRNEVIAFLEGIETDKTLKLDNLVVIDPFRKDWPETEEGLEEQVKWEVSMLNNCDIFVSYFDKSKDEKDVFPMTLFELGRNMMNIKNKFNNNKINHRILVYAHPDYALFNHLKYQVESLTEKWKDSITVENTNKNIMTVGSKILESYIKLAK